jgi:hypothetical protein
MRRILILAVLLATAASLVRAQDIAEPESAADSQGSRGSREQAF